MRLGFRHCDPRFPFLWSTAAQPAGRWHDPGDGPANYFADTPVGAWAEFMRHEGIASVAELEGVARSIWVVALPENGYAAPEGLPAATLGGGLDSYPACRAEAKRLRAAGATALIAPSAALVPGGAAGWTANLAPATARDGLVMVLFGTPAWVGWVAADRSPPPARVLPLVRPL